MWYSPQPILSYNCLFNFVVGNRGGGKTFSFKEWAVRDFLKNGKQFVYLRRYKSELKKNMMDKFFDAVAFKFPECEFSRKGNQFFIDGEVAGYAVSLSTALTIKSEEFPNVNKIGFDEFVIDKGHLRYLTNEVQAFLELYETIARARDDVRVLFLSNAVSVVNPYFLYWNMKPDPNKRFSRFGKHMIVEFYKNEEYVNMKKQTRFGQIINGTDYGDYAIENKFLKDNMNFVVQKTPTAKHRFNIVYNSKDYGVWFDSHNQLVFVSRLVDPSCKHKFVFDDSEHDIHTKLIKNSKRSVELKVCMDFYKQGQMRFEDMEIKNQMIEIFGKTA